MKRYFTILPLALLLVVPLGCGRKMPAGMPKLYPVTATVTFDDGEPVEGASVIFRLTDPVLPQSWLHAGTTDAEGKVKLVTDGEYPGIPAGKYSVTIEKYEMEKTQQPQKTESQPAPVAVKQGEAGGPGGPPPGPPPMPAPGTVIPRYQLVENAYLDHATTPLKDVEIKAGTKEITLSAGKKQRISKPLRPGGR